MTRPATPYQATSRRLVPGRHAGLCMGLALLLLTSGCGNWMPEMVPFGSVTPPDHNRSSNGLGLHRRMWEAAGAKCLTPQHLSPKLETMDVIVLVGQSYEPPGLAARRWLEGWLSRQPGRSVIYFGRDFNAEVYRRERTLALLPAAEQPRAAQLLALRQAGEMSLRLEQLPASTFCGWFYLNTELAARDYTAFRGPWGEGLDELEGYWPVQITPMPPDSQDWEKRPPSRPTPTAANTPITPSAQSGESDATVRRSQWQADELATPEQWQAELRRAPKSKTWLTGSDGRPLIFRLTAPSFRKSQIIVVANGAPFLNAALVDPLHQQLGEQIIDACLPAKRVALLAFDDSGLLISDAAEKDARGAGLEMLTVWPLSGITMPAALLGIVVCAALLPILGRPQSPVRRSVSDFGLHVEAIGRMLHESRDLSYAKSVIEEYFRTVRGEAAPAWLETLETPAPAPLVGRSDDADQVPPVAAGTLQSSDAAAPHSASSPSSDTPSNKT